MTCRPVAVLTERDMDKVVQIVITSARDHEAQGIVVGLPRPLSGGTNQQLEEVLSFVSRLRAEAPVLVETWDERFTSSLAEAGSKHRGPRDDVAACYMLQNYLDRLTADNRG